MKKTHLAMIVYDVTSKIHICNLDPDGLVSV